jgi:glycosyltransferase involved in cell wall biosynthesis
MPGPTLTVVMPVFNEAASLSDTIDALLDAIAAAGFDAEVLLVDDGSSDSSAEVARDAIAGRVPFRVLTQPNRGRFEARRRGVEAATGEWVLLLDGRVQIEPRSLEHVQTRLADAPVWTAHVDVAAEGDLLGSFWRLIAELAWADYFDDPRETSFGAAEFDRYPKGTTCFFAPRVLLLDAIAAFQSRYQDLRAANDDTQLLRWIAGRTRIHVSPEFRCAYRPRTSLRSFVRHAVHRGVVFVDGHGRRESRFLPLVVAFYPLSAALLVASLRKPLLAPTALAATGLAAASFGVRRRRKPLEVASLALVTPVYALAHGFGMWRGLALLLRQPPAGAPRR